LAQAEIDEEVAEYTTNVQEMKAHGKLKSDSLSPPTQVQLIRAD